MEYPPKRRLNDASIQMYDVLKAIEEHYEKKDVGCLYVNDKPYLMLKEVLRKVEGSED